MEENLEGINDIEGLSLYIDEQQKSLQQARDNKETLEAESFNLQLKILELQREIKCREIEKNILSQNLGKAKAICSRLALLVNRAEKKFWSVKNV